MRASRTYEAILRLRSPKFHPNFNQSRPSSWRQGGHPMTARRRQARSPGLVESIGGRWALVDSPSETKKNTPDSCYRLAERRGIKTAVDRHPR